MDSNESWASSRIFFLKELTFRTTCQLPNHRTPCSSSEKHVALPTFILCQIQAMPLSSFWAPLISSRRVDLISKSARTPPEQSQVQAFWNHSQSMVFLDETLRQLHWTFRLKASVQHSHCQDDNTLPTHSPWSIQAISFASCWGRLGWKYTWGSCGQCRCCTHF